MIMLMICLIHFGMNISFVFGKFELWIYFFICIYYMYSVVSCDVDGEVTCDFVVCD